MQTNQHFQYRNILAIGAHPDDIEYGCFGFLQKQKKIDANVHVSAYVASLGSEGDPSSGLSRKKESEAALDLLPTQQLIFREQIGLKPQDFNEVLQSLFSVIQDIQPDLILTLSPHDTHQEHRLLHEITLAAARRSKASILSYSILSNTLQFSPTIFVDIQQELVQKKKALQKHTSQKDKYYMSEEYLEIFHSHNYASLHGLRYCETFEVVRLFI